MLRSTNLKQIGNIHSGLGEINLNVYLTKIILTIIFLIFKIKFFTDDCVNIITIMNYLAQRGCVFKATNKLINV